MKTFRSISLLALVLVIGAVIGWYASAHFWKRWVESYMTADASVGVSDRYTVLRALRAGDTNAAADLLESQMDGEILAFGSILQDVPASERTAGQVRLLTRVREYRAAHPRKTDTPEVDQAIAGILSSAGGEAHK